jgi:hypothetical protein
MPAPDMLRRAAAAGRPAPQATASAVSDVSPEAALPQTVSQETVSTVPVLPDFVLPASVPAEVPPREPTAPDVVAPQAVSAEPDQDAPPVELPRRERSSLRVDESRPAEVAVPSKPRPQPQQAAARLAFADDLSAFSQGIQEALAARGITSGLVSAMFEGAAIEEGAKS